MKLKSLRLQNYRNHVDSTLNIGDAKLVVLRGANASGKTSFAEALSVNLAGTTVSLASDGKGFKRKIKQGEKEATITAEIQGQHLLRNTTTLSVGATGKSNSVECLDDPDNNKIVTGFTNFLADRRPAILIATNTEYFSKLDEEKQANLVAKLVHPSHHKFPDDKMDAVDEALGEGVIDFDGNPFDVITKAYKLLYEERKTVNVKVRDFVIPDALPIIKGVDSESLQTQGVEIRAKRANLQLERDTAVATANNIEVKRGKLQAKIEGLRAEVDKGKKRLVELEATIISAEQVQGLTETAAKADELVKLKSDHAGYLGTIRTANQQIERWTNLSEQGAICPTCDSEIDDGKIAGLIAELKKESVTADAELQALDTKIEAIGDVQAAKESLRKHEAAVKEKAELEKSLLETVATGKATRVELDALGAKVDATLPFNEPLGALQAQEDTINAQLRPVLAAEERATDRKTKAEQLAKLEAKAATLDTLVKYFDVDGVKAELIGQHIGGFQNKMLSVMEAFGYRTTLSLSPWNFEVVTKRGYSGPVKEISGAEEFIFKAALQCAVSIAAGINFVAIDEVENLGEDIRPTIYRSIFSLIQDGKLEQAILIGFSLDKTLPKPQAPGSKYFYISDGTVEELK